MAPAMCAARRIASRFVSEAALGAARAAPLLALVSELHRALQRLQLAYASLHAEQKQQKHCQHMPASARVLVVSAKFYATEVGKLVAGVMGVLSVDFNASGEQFLSSHSEGQVLLLLLSPPRPLRLTRRPPRASASCMSK